MAPRRPVAAAALSLFLGASTAAIAQTSLSPRIYVDLEYLHMRLKDAPLAVPLVSTGPIATTHHGLLGPPVSGGADSTVLYGAPHAPASGGNASQAFNTTSGLRLTAGYWFDDGKRFAAEASGFWLASRSAGYALRSDAAGEPVAGIPVYNSRSYQVGPMTIFPGEDSLPFALPEDPDRGRANGTITGGIRIRNTIDVWGAQLNGTASLYRDANWQLTGMAGLQHVSLEEGFGLVTDIAGQSGAYTGQSGVAFDSFKTTNRFYGFNLGARGRFTYGAWFAEVSGQFAPGLNHQTISVNGGYTSVNFGQTAGPEGIFAQPANEGRRSADRLAFVTQAGLKAGYAFSDRVSLTVGYQHLYYSNVVRPTDQIDRNLPKGQTFLQSAPTLSPDSPARRFQTTDFYSHGITVGLRVGF
jgi:hypothetical protein